MPHKRYLLFQFSDYTTGGLESLVGSYDTIKEALDEIKENLFVGFDTTQLYDRIEGLELDWELYININDKDSKGVYLSGETPDWDITMQLESIKAQQPENFEEFKTTLKEFIEKSKLSDFKPSESKDGLEECQIIECHKGMPNNAIIWSISDAVATLSTLTNVESFGIVSKLKIVDPNSSVIAEIIKLANKGTSVESIYNLLKDE